MYHAPVIIFHYNQQTYNQYHNTIYHNSLSVHSTLLHVLTHPCQHHTVYSQCLAEFHTLFQLQLLEIQFTRILIIIYLLTAIGLTPGGSSTVHIYTQTIHRTTPLTTQRTTQLTTI